MKLKIKKNDIVQVISGSHNGKTGKVTKVYPKTMRVMVEGVNIVKRHVKPTQANPQGGIVSMERPIHYSNVALMDKAGKPTRVGVKRNEKGQMTRVAKTTGDAI